jgi:hypothetical protein
MRARRLPWRVGLAAALAGLVFAAAMPAQAGQPCTPTALTEPNVRVSMDLALRSRQALDAGAGDVAVIARAGQDLSAHGLVWSHLGFAVRKGPGHPWRVVHKLNACGTSTASLYREGLAEFFLTDLYRGEAAIAWLTPAVQAALKPVLLDDHAPATVHTVRYNMLAYPWAQHYQQSNQWALETLAWSMAAGYWPGCRPEPANPSPRELAQAWLACAGYRPTTVRLGTLTRAAARATRANVAFDDHPDSRRFAGRIDTVTVESVFEFLDRADLASPVTLLRAMDAPPASR